MGSYIGRYPTNSNVTLSLFINKHCEISNTFLITLYFTVYHGLRNTGRNDNDSWRIILPFFSFATCGFNMSQQNNSMKLYINFMPYGLNLIVFF